MDPIEQHRLLRFAKEAAARDWIRLTVLAEHHPEGSQRGYEALLASILIGEFEDGHCWSRLLFLHPDRKPSRMTAGWMRDVIDAPASNRRKYAREILHRHYVGCCWLKVAYAATWCDRNGVNRNCLSNLVGALQVPRGRGRPAINDAGKIAEMRSQKAAGRSHREAAKRVAEKTAGAHSVESTGHRLRRKERKSR